MSACFNAGGVVDAVAGHRDDLTLSLQAPDEPYLVLGRHAGEDAGPDDDLPQLLVGELVELRPGHGPRARLQAELLPDGAGGALVVAGYHLHRDPGPLARLDGVHGLGPRGVDHALKAHQLQPARDVAFLEPLHLTVGPARGERQHPHPPRRHRLDPGEHGVGVEGGPALQARAAGQHYLRGAFDEDLPPAVGLGV
jgi:hypothetical protein